MTAGLVPRALTRVSFLHSRWPVQPFCPLHEGRRSRAASNSEPRLNFAFNPNVAPTELVPVFIARPDGAPEGRHRPLRRPGNFPITPPLFSCPNQNRFEFRSLFLPAYTFLLQLSVQRGARVLDLFDLGFMGALGFFKRNFGFGDCQFALLALFFPRGRFLLTLLFAPLFLSLERK